MNIEFYIIQQYGNNECLNVDIFINKEVSLVKLYTDKGYQENKKYDTSDTIHENNLNQKEINTAIYSEETSAFYHDTPTTRVNSYAKVGEHNLVSSYSVYCALNYYYKNAQQIIDTTHPEFYI